MIKNLLSDDEPEPKAEASATSTDSRSGVLGLFDSAETDAGWKSEEPVIVPTEPETTAETIRRSGMAYSAGVAFTAAVVFMLILGWGADLLLGSSPWGIVIGIVVGSLIGFVQLFRISSQIFKK
jgi:F0F1-type ATP synthase assembly protein I